MADASDHLDRVTAHRATSAPGVIIDIADEMHFTPGEGAAGEARDNAAAENDAAVIYGALRWNLPTRTYVALRETFRTERTNPLPAVRHAEKVTRILASEELTRDRYYLDLESHPILLNIRTVYEIVRTVVTRERSGSSGEYVILRKHLVREVSR